jgi:hypothetical protein
MQCRWRLHAKSLNCGRQLQLSFDCLSACRPVCVLSHCYSPAELWLLLFTCFFVGLPVCACPEFRRVADTLREGVPGLELATDIIAGFPGVCVRGGGQQQQQEQQTDRRCSAAQQPTCQGVPGLELATDIIAGFPGGRGWGRAAVVIAGFPACRLCARPVSLATCCLAIGSNKTVNIAYLLQKARAVSC